MSCDSHMTHEREVADVLHSSIFQICSKTSHLSATSAERERERERETEREREREREREIGLVS